MRNIEIRLNAADLGTERHSRSEHERLVRLAGRRSIDDGQAGKVSINIASRDDPAHEGAAVRNAAGQLMARTLA